MEKNETERGLYIPDKFAKYLPRLPYITTYLKTHEPYSNIDWNGVAKRQGINCKHVWRCGDKI
jgi:hypothetical protein